MFHTEFIYWLVPPRRPGAKRSKQGDVCIIGQQFYEDNTDTSVRPAIHDTFSEIPSLMSDELKNGMTELNTQGATTKVSRFDSTHHTFDVFRNPALISCGFGDYDDSHIVSWCQDACRAAVLPKLLAKSLVNRSHPFAHHESAQGVSHVRFHRVRKNINLKAQISHVMYNALFVNYPAITVPISSRRTLHPVHTSYNYASNHACNLYKIDNFLSQKEIEILLSMQKKTLPQGCTKRSAVGEKGIISSDRTSSSLHIPKAFNGIIRNIEERASGLFSLPTEAVEPLQIVHYRKGEYYKCHHDDSTLDDGRLFYDSASTSPGRTFTIFVYLNTLQKEDGGETFFPRLGLRIRPTTGTALLWTNVRVDGQLEPLTIHEGLAPVTKNIEKIGLNIWLNNRSATDLLDYCL